MHSDFAYSIARVWYVGSVGHETDPDGLGHPVVFVPHVA